jgi:AraC-like DNA-binding protein
MTFLRPTLPNPIGRYHTIKQAHVQLSAARPVRVQHLDVDHTVNPHDHDYYELLIIRRGTSLHQTENFDAPMRSGTVGIIPPAKIHAIKECKNLRVTNVYYLAEWLLADLKAYWEQDGLVPLFLAANLFRRPDLIHSLQFDLSPSEAEAAFRELDEINKEQEREKPSLLYVRASFVKFLVLLCRAYARQAERTLGFEFRKEIWLALHHMEERIENAESLNVEKLAKSVHLSVDHLTRVFKQATGYAPLEYFQRRRIQQVCRLLLNPQLSVTQIGAMLGYADSAHLCRLFKRQVGQTPKEFRKSYLPQP